MGACVCKWESDHAYEMRLCVDEEEEDEETPIVCVSGRVRVL